MNIFYDIKKGHKKIFIFSKTAYFNKSIYINKGLYLWKSNLYRVGRSDDLKNRRLNNTPSKFTFFEGKNPVYVYTGPRHSAIITENGDLYTLGTGNCGVLGHGNEDEITYPQVKRIEFFSENNLRVKKACLGDYHSLALTENGDVYTWGYGGKHGFMGLYISDYGALGHGDIKKHFLPKKIKFFEDNGIKIKDIACGVRHCVVLTGTLNYKVLDNGEIYTWGRGDYGLLGNGSNSSSLLPIKNELIEMFIKEDPENAIVKIDCADEYTGALTKKGEIYVWGKNNQGQLGIGAGIGVDFIESEKFPTLVLNEGKKRFLDLSCGENCMMMIDDQNLLYKTGRRIDYTPSIFKVSKTIQTRFFCCGNSFYCMVDENNNLYQWGDLFKKKIAEKNDYDMQRIIEDQFEKKEIMMISGKFKICGAIVKNKI